jgi:hypothetical protein
MFRNGLENSEFFIKHVPKEVLALASLERDIIKERIQDFEYFRDAYRSHAEHCRTLLNSYDNIRVRLLHEAEERLAAAAKEVKALSRDREDIAAEAEAAYLKAIEKDKEVRALIVALKVQKILLELQELNSDVFQ